MTLVALVALGAVLVLLISQQGTLIGQSVRYGGKVNVGYKLPPKPQTTSPIAATAPLTASAQSCTQKLKDLRNQILGGGSNGGTTRLKSTLEIYDCCGTWSACDGKADKCAACGGSMWQGTLCI